MSEYIFIDRSEFFRLYAGLYSFLRQEWDIRKVAGLKELLRHSFKSAEEKPDSEALYNLVLAMRTSVIIIDEIGLNQPAVCAVLLFHTVVIEGHSPEEIEQLFGSEVERILRGLKKVNQ